MNLKVPLLLSSWIFWEHFMVSEYLKSVSIQRVATVAMWQVVTRVIGERFDWNWFMSTHLTPEVGKTKHLSTATVVSPPPSPPLSKFRSRLVTILWRWFEWNGSSVFTVWIVSCSHPLHLLGWKGASLALAQYPKFANGSQSHWTLLCKCSEALSKD